MFTKSNRSSKGRKLSRNRKSQVFIVGVIMIVTGGLVSAFIIMNYLYQPKTQDEYLGTYQAGMVDAIQDGDRAFAYIDLAAKYSVQDAIKEFSDNGGIAVYDDQGDKTILKCKSYVYPLWNNEGDECYPDYKETFGSYMSRATINKFGANAANDINFQKQIDFDFAYGDPGMESTAVKMIANDKYIYNVYKTKEIKNQPSTQAYVNNKVTYSGDIYTIGSGSCTDIVNYATNYLGVPYTKHTIAEPPDKAVSTGLQCGTFVTSVFKFGSTIALPIGNGNNKCYNFETNTVAPTVALVWKRTTDFTCVTSLDCMTNQMPALSQQELDRMNLQPGDIFSSTSPTTDGQKFGHTGIYVGKGRLEEPADSWHYKKFIPDPNGKQAAIHSGTVAYSYISDLEANNRKMIAFCRPKACTSNANPVITMGCQTKSNPDWKITNLKVSAAGQTISGDQKVSIIMSIENSGTECALIQSNPKITILSGLKTGCIFPGSNSCEFWPYTSDTIEVQTVNNYLTLGKDKFADTPAIECTFTTDAAKAKEEQTKGNCVLLAPTGDTPIKYRITAYAKDGMKTIKPTSSPLTKEFEVVKPAANPNQQDTGNNPDTPALKVPLTPQEQKKIDDTKANLIQLGARDSVVKYAKQYNIPEPILLGKITQETGADPKYANACNPVGACGISQVMFNLHGNKGGLIDKACGKVYTREEYIADKDCQIKSGALYLKQQYDAINGATLYYVCPRFCYTAPGGKQICQDAVDKTYTGWEAALRRYNGGGDLQRSSRTSGCINQPDFTYVEKVMRWASAWGYSGYEAATQYQLTAVEEVVGKGIIGTYSIYPSFTVDVPFDFRLIENLTDYMKQVSDICRVSTLDRNICINLAITDFNDEVSQEYINNGIYVNLTRDCDGSTTEKSFNGFIESLEDCATAPDFNCRCRMNRTSPFTNIKVVGKEGVTTFYYKDTDDVEKSADSYIEFRDGTGFSSADYTSMNNVYIVKRLGYMQLAAPANMRICDSVHNKYTMCLKTGYQTTTFENSQPVNNNITLKFAITIRDNEPPPPVTGVALYNKKYSNKSVIVAFDESNINSIKVADVGVYRIYLSDNEAIYSGAMPAIRNVLTNYRTIDVKNTGYTRYKDMDIA
jgi:hypothetical protein